ncbi:replication protein P [Haemophilus parainfluenzae]|uniref:replication protein P n=1 Tax=Haemophilus parainfluenzae TaxID=729 RepID=UPI001956EDA9|nr:replication protein P [Haemophilus parainfluenzae]VTX61040.1 Replication protein P [Haemophilus parainfluenzae]
MKNVIPMDPAKSTVTKSSIPSNAVRLIDRMFVRLKSIFPAWKHAFNSEIDYNETKQVWLEELFKAGVVNPQSLKRGLDLAAKSESPFFPSVGQFITWCEFENYHELGLPTPEELSSRIQKYFGYAKEPHNFKFRSKAEYYLLKTIYDGYSKKKWEDCQKAMPKILAEVVDKARTGFEFPQIPELLEQKPKVIPPEVSKNGVAKIKEIMGIA